LRDGSLEGDRLSNHLRRSIMFERECCDTSHLPQPTKSGRGKKEFSTQQFPYRRLKKAGS
jgi:hypothetical protein